MGGRGSLFAMIYRDATAACPRCKVDLETATDGGHEYLTCRRCSGLWLDYATLRLRWRGIASNRPLPRMTPRTDHQRRLPCVLCGAPMDKVMLEAVELDRCDGHGIWLDHGELARVLSTAELEGLIDDYPPAQRSARREPAREALRVNIAVTELAGRLNVAKVTELAAWPPVAIAEVADRKEYDAELVQTQAQLSLAELDAAAGDVHAYEDGLRRALERLEPAAARWPTSVELNVRLAAALVALAEVVERKPGGEPEARALGERAVSKLEPLRRLRGSGAAGFAISWNECGQPHASAELS
jgi:Zn-finger nucleic acid-binding protein